MPNLNLHYSDQENPEIADLSRLESTEKKPENVEINQISSTIKKKVLFAQEYLSLLNNLNKAEQYQVFDLISKTGQLKVKDIDWDLVFQHPQYQSILDAILALPGQLKISSQEDLQQILKLNQIYGSSRLLLAWKNAGEPLLAESYFAQTNLSTPAVDWPKFNFLVLLGSLENSDPEVISSLTEKQLKKLELMIKIYGLVNMQDIWTRESLEDFQELEEQMNNSHFYRQEQENGLQSASRLAGQMTEQLRNHIPKSSNGGTVVSSTKRPGRNMSTMDGIYGRYQAMLESSSVFEAIPAENRNQFLSLIKPYDYPIRVNSPLSVSQVENIISFIKTSRLKNQLSLDQAFRVAPFFEGENYKSINGFLSFLEKQDLIQTITYKNYFSFVQLISSSSSVDFERIKSNLQKAPKSTISKLVFWDEQGWENLKKLDLPESESANQFLNSCASHHDKYLRQRYNNAHLYDRDSKSVSDIYKSFKIIDDYLKLDQDIMLEIAGLDKQTREVIKVVFNPNFQDIKNNQYDLAYIEGNLMDLSWQLRDVLPVLEFIKNFPREHKLNWLYLKSYFQQNRYIEFLQGIMKKDGGTEIRKFLENLQIEKFSPAAVEKMINYPAYLNLFRLVDPSSYSEEMVLNIIDRLVIYGQAGLNLSHFKDEPFKSNKLGGIELDKHLNIESAKFIQLTDYLIKAGGEIPKYSLSQLNFSEPYEALVRRIKFSQAVEDEYNLGPIEAPSQESIQNIEEQKAAWQSKLNQRINYTKQIVGQDLSENLQKKLSHLSDQAWQRISSHPDILNAFINNSTLLNISDQALQLSDQYLSNPNVWKYQLLEQIFDDQLMGKSLALLQSYPRNQFPDFFKNKHNDNINVRLIKDLATIWPANKIFLENPEFLKKFQGRNELLREFFQVGTYVSSLPNLNQSEGYSQSQQQMILSYLDYFDLDYSYDWKKLISLIEENKFQLPPAKILNLIKQKFGGRVTLDIGLLLIDQIKSGLDPLEFSQSLDNQTHFDDNKYHWDKARKGKFKVQIGEIIGSDLEIDTEYLSINHLETISRLPKSQLLNLHKIGIFKSYSRMDENPQEWENILYLSSHPKFDLINSKNQDGYLFYNLIHVIPDRLKYFADHLDARTMDLWEKANQNLRLDLIDSVVFFQHPNANQIIEFATRLGKILGPNSPISVYDLLIMDSQADLQALQDIAANTSLELNQNNLQHLLLTCPAHLQGTINKVLSIVDHGLKIDYSLAAEKINQMSPGLRYAVLKNKGIKSFGPKILEHKEQIKNSVSPEEWEEFIRRLFASGEAFDQNLDFENAKIILSDPNFKLHGHNWALDKFTRLLKSFSGDAGQWEQLIELTGQERIMSTFKTQWDWLPAGLRQSNLYWQIIKNNDVNLLFYHYADKPKQLEIEPEFLDRAIDIVEPGNLINLLDLSEKKNFPFSPEQIERIIIRYLSLNGYVKNLFSPDQRLLSLEKIWVKAISAWPQVKNREELLRQTVRADLLKQDLGTIEVSKSVELKLLQAFAINKLQHQEINNLIGERIIDDQQRVSSELNQIFIQSQLAKLSTNFQNNAKLEINQDNWLEILIGYIKVVEDVQIGASLSSEQAAALQELFKDDKNKDFCLGQVEKLWNDYLSNKDRKTMPASLILLSDFVKIAEGAGPMSKLESLLLLINSHYHAQIRPVTSDQTKDTLYENQKEIQQRFKKERWSDGDKVDFFNIFSTVTSAAPSLSTDFARLFKKLSLNDMKKFQNEVFPLFNVQILMIENGKKSDGSSKYDLRSLFGIRRKIKAIEASIAAGSVSFENTKTELIQEIQKNFQSRFGIIKTPDSFGPDQMKALINCSIYLSNMSNRQQTQTNLLAYYLALIINGKWESFRRGEKINPGEYMSPTVAADISAKLSNREKMLGELWANTGIPAYQLPQFQEILQPDQSSLEIGNVETIDVKLANLAINMRRLEDPDLYPLQLDQDRLQLMRQYGNKQVGSVVAKIYQSLAGRSMGFSEEELQIKQQIESILTKNKLPVQPDTVKKYFQEEMKPLSLISNVLADINNFKVEDEIENLRQILQPDEQVISIFKRLGEDFKPASGAFALSQDLDFLDNLIVKRTAELHDHELASLQQYLSNIRAQMIKLEGIYQQLKLKFTNVKGAQHGSELLRAKLQEIEKIVNASDTGKIAVTSVMTNNLSLIIENIRECLSCVRKGINNDTNLSFGDGNKFFLYSHSDQQKKGSIADQIVFIEPLSFQNPDTQGEQIEGPSEMAFVLDRLYGNCTPFILSNHLKTIYKKYKSIKDRFPTARMSIFVTNAALSTSGISADLLANQLSSTLDKDISASFVMAKVNVVESALSDHYIEFGGGCRTSGNREVSGLKISL